MKKISIIQNLTFIPKLMAGESEFTKLGLRCVLMDAYIVAYYPKPARKIAKACELFIIDTNTNYFIDKYYLSKPTFRKLFYKPKIPFKIEDLLIDESLRKKKMVEPAINYQLNQGVGIIILPYIFAEGPTDTKFGINLNLIADSIKYIEDKKIEKPIFAMINIGDSVLTDPKTLNYIVERYDDDFGKKIQGYCIMIDQFKEKESVEESLRGLAYLVFQLSRNKDVIVLRIGGFGEILSAIGASGFSSGLLVGESFSKESLTKKSSGFGRPISKWTYVPELFTYVNDEMIKKINYKCNCPACKGSTPKTIFSKKAHFLYNRNKIMQKLNNLSREKRINLMKYLLDEAIKLAFDYTKKGILLKSDYLIRWRRVLDSATDWSYEDGQLQKDIDLDKIIHEARTAKRKR